MKEKRIVVTGQGVISSNGSNIDEFWKSLLMGECGIHRISSFDPSDIRTQIAAEVKVNYSEFIDEKKLGKMDRFTQHAIYASHEAVKQAGLLELDSFDPDRVGVIIASGTGGLATMEEGCAKLREKGARRVPPLVIPKLIIDIASGLVSIEYGFKGPNFSVVSACSSSTHAIGEAMWILKRGDADIIVCGGAEGAVTPIGIASFASLKATSTRNDTPQKSCTPFDMTRDGFVMAEGAGILVLETLESAQKRGSKILAEIVGYGATGDAYHMTAPSSDGEGAVKAIQVALGHAKMKAEDISYVNAHGTGTKLNDKYETIAYKKIFGKKAYNVPISSTKSMTGHSLGAVGAWESIVCIQSIINDIIPPTINLENPDPDCDLDYVKEGARKMVVNNTLNVNLGFGGHNAALIFKKFK